MSDFVERQIILGAGASDGFPLGSELISIIKTIGWEILNLRHSGKAKLPSDFVNNLLDLIADINSSCAVSIDFYTSRIRDKNKQRIAESLVAAIINSFEFDQKTTWYGHLLQRFFPESFNSQTSEEKLESIRKKTKEVRIITFNYDLSLEKYLYSFLKKNIFYEKEDAQFLAEAKKEVFSRIDHVYGSVDDPLICDLEVNRRFKLRKTEDELRIDTLKKSVSVYHFCAEVTKDAHGNQEKYCQNINLIESKRSGEKSTSIKVSKCNYLYVLGFGFDPLNIEKIGLDSDAWVNGCFVTNLGDNQRIRRIAISTLCRTKNSENYDVPIISKLSVKAALEKDFSLSEKTLAEKIPKSLGNISPYFGMMKYEK